MEKIGIFGGAFNPIHYGHLRTAEEVADMLALDRVLFIPSGKPAFKKPGLADARHRYQMTKRAIDDNPLFAISDIELKTPGRSYSADTVRKIKEMYDDYNLYFIMGIDAFADLPDWKEPESLITLANIVVISRPEYLFADLSSSPYIKRIPKKALRELDKGERKKISFKMPSGQRCHLLNVTELNISASRIRNLLMYGKNAKYLLPDSVKSYIISHRLYKKVRES
ncbi:MAG: nicotinate-nucleotide adenylyltransferase [Nitrospirae bacterium]|nr:nicotinate-nucleotide adenylyltransferase [Nitrospirota bacterium]